MKNLSVFLTVVVTCISLSVFADVIISQEEVDYPPLSVVSHFSINVKDFGAKGDGLSDDTDAIQRAADAANVKPSQRAWQCTRFLRCMHDAPVPEIVFPEGTYVLTRPVVFNWSTTIRGVGDVTIKNISPDKDSFYFEYALRVEVENMKFDGGLHQIRHWTNNLDTATAKISGCTFMNATKVAFHAASYRIRTNKKYNSRYEMQKDGVYKLRIGPYEVKRKNGKVEVIPRPPETLQEYENSTNLLIKDCLFKDNACAMNIRSDGVIVRDSKIITPHNMKGAAIIMGCKSHLFNLEFDINRNPELPQYVIEQLSGVVMLSDSVIRSNRGISVFLVKANASTSMIASATNIRNVVTSCGNKPVIEFAEDCFPNIVTVYGIVEDKSFSGKSSGEKIKLFAFDKNPTSEELDSRLKHKRHPYLGLDKSYSISLARIDDDFDTSLPKSLQKHLIRIPDNVIQTPERKYNHAKFRGKMIYDLSIGGEKMDKDKDDTKKFQALLKKAEKLGGGIIVLPPKWIRINQSLNVPDNTLVYCPGRALIVMKNDNMPVFVVKNPKKVMFVNLTIQRGLNAIDISGNSGNVYLDNCCLYDQKKESIRAMAATEKNKLLLMVAGGVVYSPFLYYGNASLAFFDGIWYSSNPDYPKGDYKYSYASMTNLKGGYLYITDMLGVPCYFRHIPMNLIWRPAPEKNGDFRWIDNYGIAYLLNNRFGGEWGGITPVYQYGNAQTYMEGAFVSLNCPRIVYSPVVSDSKESTVTLVNLISTLYNKPLELKYKTKNGNVEVQKKQNIFCCYPARIFNKKRSITLEKRRNMER